MKFRKLKADEIDCRISMVGSWGVGLLLYKDARCDQNILDETVGEMNWQRHHTRDNANCIVSIWDDTKKQWIEKEDTGTESFTEKEKGLASDSFKRACFNWGIGRELYTAPSMFIKPENLKKHSQENGKWTCKDTFTVTEIEYTDDKISFVKVYNTTAKKEISFGERTGNENDTSADEQLETQIEKTKKKKISDIKIKSLEERIKEDGISLDGLLRHYKVSDLKNLNEEQLSHMNMYWEDIKKAYGVKS